MDLIELALSNGTLALLVVGAAIIAAVWYWAISFATVMRSSPDDFPGPHDRWVWIGALLGAPLVLSWAGVMIAVGGGVSTAFAYRRWAERSSDAEAESRAVRASQRRRQRRADDATG